jgi:dTDP-4-dehydrorhamnose 3,5-epimerase
MSRIITTTFEGLVIYEPSTFEDPRGHFFESFNQKLFEEAGLNYNWIQDNQSKSKFGVIRGLHFQTGKFEQAKLVRCVNGSILDVAVDLRPNSKTYKSVFSIELTSDNKKSILIPRGFAHGFCVLSGNAEVLYKCDNIYNKESEGGIIYNDTELDIDWQVSAQLRLVSEKDSKLPTLKEYCDSQLN